jgi:hypothetical protein
MANFLTAVAGRSGHSKKTKTHCARIYFSVLVLFYGEYREFEQTGMPMEGFFGLGCGQFRARPIGPSFWTLAMDARRETRPASWIL